MTTDPASCAQSTLEWTTAAANHPQKETPMRKKGSLSSLWRAPEKGSHRQYLSLVECLEIGPNRPLINQDESHGHQEGSR